MSPDTYSSKRVLVTGDTGFVGTWLKTWLRKLGAEVTGLSLPLDVGDRITVETVVERSEPEIVFHLAAQAFVSRSYQDPLETLRTNVMGTANVLDVILQTGDDIPCVIITSDKCYAPSETPHIESDPVGGDDIYSASKGAAELVTHAYRKSFDMQGVATARAGNIIGGGDWSVGRLVPDCIRALQCDETLELRNPNAVRPWQHVLDATYGYLLLGEALLNGDTGDAWNFGPNHGMTVGQLASMLGVKWSSGSASLNGFDCEPNALHETEVLRLDSTKARGLLGWSPLLSTTEMVEWTLLHYISGAVEITGRQIDRYMERVA